MIITLTRDEAVMVLKETDTLMQRQTQEGFINNHNFTSNKPRCYQIGAAAEVAVCKYLKVSWRGYDVGGYHNGDAGKVEVRCTQYQSGRLILNKRDVPKKERPFIHVISKKNLEFQLMGWLFGYEVIKDENVFYRSHFKEDLWRVENDKLRGMDEIYNYIDG